MEKINARLVLLFSLAWFIYLLYTIVQSFVDYQNLQRVDWQDAENVSSMYKGYKATVLTRAYKKDNIIIQRDYGYLGQGINMWFSGINKKDRTANISFYVKDKDVVNDSIFKIPYFGLREMNRPAASTFLFLDLWKFNYSKAIAFAVMFSPLLFTFLIAKVRRIENFKLEDLNVEGKIVNYLYLAFIICLFINFVV